MMTPERLNDFMNANAIVSVCINDALEYFLGDDYMTRDFTQEEYDKCDGIIYRIQDALEDKKFINFLCENAEVGTDPVQDIHDLILLEIGVEEL